MGWNRKMRAAALLLAAALLAGGIWDGSGVAYAAGTGRSGESGQGTDFAAKAEGAFATIAADGAIYAAAASGGVKAQAGPSLREGVTDVLPGGRQVRLLGACLREDGLWFLAEYGVGGETRRGYVRDEDLASADGRLLEWKSKFLGAGSPFPYFRRADAGETDLSSFPESYRAPIRSLAADHPDWVFLAMDTGLTWEEVLESEMEDGRNLVEDSAPVTWKSMAPGDYNSKTGKFVVKDGTSWVQASEVVVRHYLDPRNFLNEDSVFQFEQLTFQSDCQTEDGVEQILSGSFMSKKKLEDGSGGGITYAQAFMKIGKELKVSPYFLASRVLQEQGAKGTSPLISGKYKGYEGYYNYFNREATGVGEQVIRNGLAAAKKKGWNTRYKALSGGAASISSDYIARGQDTLYLQKFDVDDSYDGLYWHQYMQNLSAADSEGKSVRDSYDQMGALENSFVFKVPVYEDMPSAACPLPDGTLGRPSLTVKKSGDEAALLSWKPVEGAYGYQIYRKAGEDGKYVRIRVVNGADKTSYEDGKVEPGKAYHYKMRAYVKLQGGNQYSEYSAEKGVDFSIPRASWRSLSLRSYGSAVLKWQQRRVDGYKVYRKADKGKYKCVATIKDNTVTEYVDEAVRPGHKYTYRIRSYRKISGQTYYSEYTKERKVEDKVAAAKLNKAKRTGKKKVALSWKRDKKATGYLVYRAEKKNGKYKKVKSFGRNDAVSWTDTSVKPGKDYYYKVRTYAKIGKKRTYSAFSNIKAAKK